MYKVSFNRYMHVLAVYYPSPSPPSLPSLPHPPPHRTASKLEGGVGSSPAQQALVYAFLGDHNRVC